MPTDISPAQIRMARALLDISRDDVEAATEVAKQTLLRIENGAVKPREETLRLLLNYFEERGIEFQKNDGVRRRSVDISSYEGIDAFGEFYDFVYESIKRDGGDVCICGSNAAEFAKYRKNPQVHRDRMTALVRERSDIRVRTIIKEGDTNTLSEAYTTYRFLPKEYFSSSSTTFYVFGACYALISFAHTTPPFVVCVHSKNMADDYRKSFNALWDHITIPSLEVGPA